MLQRTWIWESYFAETDENKQAWLAGAEALRHINVQVLEDIEDYILLKGFKGIDGVRTVADIDRMIASDLAEKRERLRVQVEDAKEDPDPIEEGKHEDKKRKFAVKNRPHEKVWSLLED